MRAFLAVLFAWLLAGAASAQTANWSTFYSAGTATSPCNGAVGSLQFNFAVPSSCAGALSAVQGLGMAGVTYTAPTLSGTGATVSTAIDKEGVVHDFASGVTRLTDAGVQLDPNASTNKLLQALAFGTSPWTSSGVTLLGGQLAPDGTSTAFKMTATTTGTDPTVSQAVTTVGGTNYSFSDFVTPGTEGLHSLDVYYPSTGDEARVTWTISSSCPIYSTYNSTITFSSACQALPTGGYRFDLNFTAGASDTSAAASIVASDNNGTVVAGSTTTIWCAQFEAGPETSCIPTTTAAVTRSADVGTWTYTACPTCSAQATYRTGSIVSTTAAPITSPLNLGTSGAGGWLGGALQSIVVYPAQPPPPPQAIAAGYTLNTFSTTVFTTANTDTTASYAAGYQWYKQSCFSTPSSDTLITLNADGSISTSSNSAGSNDGVSSIGCISGSPGYHGTAFGGGAYIEATLKFNYAAIVFADGWPAWWAYAAENFLGLPAVQWAGQATGYLHYIEDDMMESYGGVLNYAATMHDWYGISSAGNVQLAQYFLPNPSINFNAYHKYGERWIPATASTSGSMTYYFDGVQVGTTQTWTQFTSQSPPPTTGSPWLFGIIDQDHLVLLFNGGFSPSPPITVLNVNVWQATAANNIHN